MDSQPSKETRSYAPRRPADEPRQSLPGNVERLAINDNGFTHSSPLKPAYRTVQYSYESSSDQDAGPYSRPSRPRPIRRPSVRKGDEVHVRGGGGSRSCDSDAGSYSRAVSTKTSGSKAPKPSSKRERSQERARQYLKARSPQTSWSGKIMEVRSAQEAPASKTKDQPAREIPERSMHSGRTRPSEDSSNRAPCGEVPEGSKSSGSRGWDRWEGDEKEARALKYILASNAQMNKSQGGPGSPPPQQAGRADEFS